MVTPVRTVRPLAAGIFALPLALALIGPSACSKSTDDGATTGTGGASSSGGRGGAGSPGSGGNNNAGAGGGGGTSGGATGGNSGGNGAGGTGSGGTAGAPGTGGTTGTGGAASDAAAPEDAAAETGGVPADAAANDGPFTLTSAVFKEGQDIAKMYMCKHENLSPPLSWTPGPAGTMSYAVTMLHAASLHWVLWDIPASTTSLPVDIAKMPMPPVPAGSKQAKPNIDGATWYGYTGPCPSSSSHYEYIVHAMKVATLPGVTSDSTTAAVNALIIKNELKSAQLSGTASAK